MDATSPRTKRLFAPDAIPQHDGKKLAATTDFTELEEHLDAKLSQQEAHQHHLHNFTAAGFAELVKKIASMEVQREQDREQYHRTFQMVQQLEQRLLQTQQPTASSTPNAAPTRLPANLSQPFTGETDRASLRAFLTDVDINLTAATDHRQPFTDSKKAAYLFTNCNGEARQFLSRNWATGLHLQAQPYSTVQQALVDEFLNQATRNRTLQDLLKLRQGSTPLHKHVTAFTNMCDILGSSITDDVLQVAFLASLDNPHTRSALTDPEFFSIRDMLSAATRKLEVPYTQTRNKERQQDTKRATQPTRECWACYDGQGHTETACPTPAFRQCSTCKRHRNHLRNCTSRHEDLKIGATNSRV